MSSSVQTARRLLADVSKTAKECKNRYHKTGMAYNIFAVTRMVTKEVEMCRVLADVLNPKGLHGQESAYLNLFMDMIVRPLVGNAQKTGFSWSRASAIPQYYTDEGRFIDIVISAPDVFIPIEVKINASEEENQLSHYAAFSKKKNQGGGFPVLFITPTGRFSQDTALDKNDYVSVSFKEHIIPWLEECCKLKSTPESVQAILKQYITAINLFCGYAEDGMESAINDLIMESSENYEAAFLIAKTIEGFENKIWDIFKDKIDKLVRSQITDVGVSWQDKDKHYGWLYLYFKFSNGCVLSINYDMRRFCVEVSSRTAFSGDTADRIRAVMSNITGEPNASDHVDTIWSCDDARYPALKNVDKDNVGRYKKELYHIYRDDPESVAANIVSWVNELKKQF